MLKKRLFLYSFLVLYVYRLIAVPIFALHLLIILYYDSHGIPISSQCYDQISQSNQKPTGHSHAEGILKQKIFEYVKI